MQVVVSGYESEYTKPESASPRLMLLHLAGQPGDVVGEYKECMEGYCFYCEDSLVKFKPVSCVVLSR